MLLLVAVIAGSLVLAARRAPEGGSAFMLSESEALARLTSRIGVVARDGLDACVYSGTTAPANKENTS